MKTKLLAVAAAFALASTSQAAVVTSVLSNVTILGNVYNVTFQEDTSGATFNGVFGAGGPSLPFDASNAQAATQDLLTAVDAVDFDVKPGGLGFQVFALVFEFDATNFSYYTGWRNTPGNAFVGVLGSFQVARDFALGSSFVNFEAVNDVPAPATLALVGLALAMLGIRRRRPGSR